MIKFKATMDGRPVVGFYLTEGNIAKLKAGDRIHIMAAEMNLPFDVMIGYGKDAESIERALRDGGAVTAETAIITSPSTRN